MASPTRILAFAGSARRESLNRKFLAVAVQALRGAGCEVTVADLRDYRVPATGHLTIQAAWASAASQLSQGVAGRIARQPPLPPVLREILDRLNPEHLLATPIIAGGRRLGVLALCRSADRPGYGEADIAVVETLARETAVIIDSTAKPGAHRR